MFTLKAGKILVPGKDFNIRATVECGQLFRVTKKADSVGHSVYELISKDKKCLLAKERGTVVIHAAEKDIGYFVHYFDLETSYAPMLKELRRQLLSQDAQWNFVLPVENAFQYGKGLRLLKQDKFETLISFIISTNNNIKRIKTIIEKICAALGRRCKSGGGSFFAFPAAEKMAAMDEGFYREMGCGYRAAWILEAAQRAAELRKGDFDIPDTLSTEELIEKLMAFRGIGPKAADCIALFAFNRYDVFPVDTWVKKIYVDLFNGGASEKTMRKNLINRFGCFSGIAQQFLFYYYRETAGSR
jgi:N-glycosylase/DNA lyase